MAGRRWPIAAVIWTFAAVWLSSPAAAADCLPSTREIKFPDGSARVKNYVCRLAGSSKPKIEVEFDRLSEAAAGNLVEGTSYPDLARALGSWTVIRNDVFAEAKALFDTYGRKDLVDSCYRFDAGTETGPKPYRTNPDKQVCNEKRAIWYLSFPDMENLTSEMMPELDAQKIIQSSTDWPPGWNFFYHHCRQSAWIECTLLWRPARRNDLADYWDNLKKYEDQLALADKDSGAMPPDSTVDPEVEKETRAAKEKKQRFFALLQHVATETWPDDFLTITGSYAACGGGFDFALHVRQLALEVAFVKNISSEPMSVDELIGIADVERALRTGPDAGAARASEAVRLAATTLRPGEKIAIPLKIVFVPAGGADAIFQSGLDPVPLDRPAAEQAFKAIMAAKPGTIFREKESDAKQRLRKVRESFGAPTVPKVSDYTYGPAFDLKGLTLSGERVEFDSGTRNFFKIAAGEGYGSCPFLYAYDAATDSWLRRGKIIHAASSPKKEMTQRIEFPGLTLRFAIREEELEVAYIRSVQLELLLSDDRLLVLTPRTSAEVNGSEGLTVIRSGQGREFGFDLPESAKAAEVKRSTLIVSGYYRPYSSIAIARP
jgi:hypothetical protein